MTEFLTLRGSASVGAYCWCLRTVLLVILAVGIPTYTDAAGRVLTTSLTSLTSVVSKPDEKAPVSAAIYLDELFADSAAARDRLAKDFTKKSRVALIYTCFERAEIIRAALNAILVAEGISDIDLIISQDAGTKYKPDVPIPDNINWLYVKHITNLCTGQHHYFVKRFAFDVMGYETLIVVEEDNVLHPQALKMLTDMIDISASDKEVGVVSIADMDNSMLFDEARYGAAVLRVDVDIGHLWVFALHASRYQAVRHHLIDYYEVIKGRDYRNKDLPPLKDDISKLMVAKGFPSDAPLSQDHFFVQSLAKEGFTRRLATLVRLFEPLGWAGLHFHQDPNSFYSLYGKGMYEGRIEEGAFEVTRDPEELAELERECRARLDRIYMQYLGRNADENAANTAVMRLLIGRMNAVELIRDIINSAEHRRRMKEFVSGRMQQQAAAAAAAQAAGEQVVRLLQ